MTMLDELCDAATEGRAAAFRELATPDEWRRLPDTVYGLIGMLSGARSMRREDVAILTHALGICRETLRHRPVEFGGPRECR